MRQREHAHFVDLAWVRGSDSPGASCAAQLREQLALAARVKIETCFSIEKNSAQLLSLIQQVGADENTLSV